MDESQQRQTPSSDSTESAPENQPRPWVRNLDTVPPGFLPDKLTEFREQLLDTTRYSSSQRTAAQTIERALKTLQSGIASMQTENWQSLSNKVWERLETDKEPTTQDKPSKINSEIYRIAMTHLGKMKEVVNNSQLKTAYLQALSQGQRRGPPSLRRSDTSDHASAHGSDQQAEAPETTAASLRFTEDDARYAIASPTNRLASNPRNLSENQRSGLSAAVARIRNLQNDHRSSQNAGRGLDEWSRSRRDDVGR